MKILFLTRKYPPQKGGMESYSYNLISNYLGEKKIIALKKKQAHLLWFYPFCFFYTIFSVKKYDVIQLGDMLLCGIGWAAKKIKPSIKVVATIHGLDITYQNKLYQLYLKLFSKGFDMYIPNSTFTNNVAEGKGYHPTKIIFPATLSEQRFVNIERDRRNFQQKYNVSEDKIILCTTGRLVRRKGVEWFIRNVFPLINKIDIIYLIVGSGYMKEEIERAILETKENRIKIMNWVSDEELDEIYINTDIFIMPNIFVENDVEGYGMVAIEAAAAKCIVVASKMQGIEDAVKDQINGILVEPENKDAFAKTINAIINNIDEYGNQQEKAREYVMEKCTGKKVAEDYRQIFENLE